MRLTCPNCDAQYEIDDALVPPQGRDVECSACGQVWFQPRTVVDTPPVQAANQAAPEAPRPLNRQLSASVLSILQDEVAFERRARDAERQIGTENGAHDLSGDHAHAAGPSAEGVTLFDIPLVDWPATTVTAPEETAAPTVEPAAFSVPPLVLPDAEKLAATLNAPVPVAEAATKADAGNTAAKAPPEDVWSLPGDATEDAGGRSLLATSETVELPEGQLYMAAPENEAAAPKDDEAPHGGDQDPAQITPDVSTTANAPAETGPAASATASQAPVSPERASPEPVSPAPAAKPQHQNAAANARNFLPATVDETAAPEGRAGYRTGFGIAVMLMLLAVTFYFLAPRLAGQGEFGAKVMEWHQSIDQARFWLHDRITALFASN